MGVAHRRAAMSASEPSALPRPGPLAHARGNAQPTHPIRRTTSAASAHFEGPAGQLRELAEAIVRRIRRRPLTSLAVAIGVGFVVGGALSFRAGRVALAAAVRHIAREVLKQVL
jgi:hypothetical protein